MNSKADRLPLLCAFAAGILLRLLAAGFQPLSHDAAAYYLPNARALVEGGFANFEAMSIAVPPLYPFLVALLAVPVGDLEIAALAISVVAGAAVVYPAAALARRLFPTLPAAAPLTAWMAALCPYAVRFGGDARADALYTLAVACAIAAGIALLSEPRARTGALFGALTGAAYLLRPEALGMPLLLAAGVVAQGTRLFRAGGEWRAYARRVLGAGVLGFALLSPALAWNMSVVHAKLGIWTLSPKAGILLEYDKTEGSDPFSRLNDAKTMTEHEEKLSNPASYRRFTLLSELREHPREMLQAMAKHLWDFFIVLPGALGVLFSIYFAAGLGGARGLAARGALAIPVAVSAFYGLSFSVFYVSQRFWVPLLVLFYPWCAAGALAIRDWCARRGISQRAVIALSLATLMPETLQVQNWKDFEWRASPEQALGARLASSYEPGVPCLSAKGIVTWYAGAAHLFIPNAPFEDLVAYMRNRRARLIVLQVSAASAASVADAGGAEHQAAADDPPRRRDERVLRLMQELDRSSSFLRVDLEPDGERTYLVYELAE